MSLKKEIEYQELTIVVKRLWYLFHRLCDSILFDKLRKFFKAAECCESIY